MDKSTDRLIDKLAGDLQPTSRLRQVRGRALVATAMAGTILLAFILLGRHAGTAIDLASAMFVLTNGLLLVLALVSSLTVVSMAQPRVGSTQDAPKWALASVMLLPLAAIGAATAGRAGAGFIFAQRQDFTCFVVGSLFAFITAGVLLYWLRKGAPVLPEKAGLFLGLGAGAMGSFANGLFCPDHSIWHLGIWHVLPVVLWGLIGRIALPPLVRW
ncbi:DUF1109 family protein [Porphyrobacter algicida]|uniref:DUF1109 family protein n=1 Tax=Qipengyuania algicida TaxID=1836209 RepID=A0A845AGJ8_9SPHN|nr:DUF1109 domain-containing protein [Qipengyuania algicida]MXP29722.1 DUF1109 family protein [Qipengyuania algicida]